MKGKCFCYGCGENMADNSRVARDVKYRSCGAQGHIQLICGQGKARSIEESLNNDMLAIKYQQKLHQYQQSTPFPPLLL